RRAGAVEDARSLARQRRPTLRNRAEASPALRIPALRVARRDAAEDEPLRKTVGRLVVSATLGGNHHQVDLLGPSIAPPVGGRVVGGLIGGRARWSHRPPEGAGI